MIPIRTSLVKLPSHIKSAYPIGAHRGELVSVNNFPDNQDCVPQDVHAAILKLDEAVAAAGGDFRLTDVRRTVDTQAVARKRYENWLAAGKPSREDPEWVEAGMKNSYVSKPGFSFHNAGRAIDIDIKRLEFRGIAPDLVLDVLWDISKHLGWRPIIKSPEETASEAWHFDLMGEWSPVFDRLGYKDAAMCASLDIGIAVYGRDLERLIQAQLHRAGADVGEVDGYVGAKTKEGLDSFGLTVAGVMSDMGELFRLPSALQG